ncbi:MAG: MAPEG family protein [Myxococcales bacterium]|nr:MAPEG family protein [Myxococcales bacterium]
MTTWILAVLALWVAQTFLPTTMRLVQAPDMSNSTMDHLKGKDNAPELSIMGGRANRALDNLQQALPVFLTLALLLEIRGVTDSLAIQGAMVFFVARVLYVPAYMVGILGVRSTVWFASWVGLGMMIAALLGSGIS